MASHDRRLSMRQRQSLKPIPTWRWPVSPRPIAEETLSSYCIRLGAPYRLDLTGVLDALGIPRLLEPHLVELDTSAGLVDRLAATTGRAGARFEGMKPAATDPLLPTLERTAFCTACWLERRRADAAYLSRRWALPGCLTCPRHEGGLLQEWSRISHWPRLFDRRQLWPNTGASSLPPVWHAACEALGVAPEQEWQEAEGLMRAYEQALSELIQGTAMPAHLRMYADLVCYLQIQWDPLNWLPQLGPAAFSIYEQELCTEHFPRGTFASRLKRLIAARHVQRAFQTGAGDSRLATKLMAEIESRKRTHVEGWWLRRRLAHWAPEDRSHALKVFGRLRGRMNDFPAFDACRHCIRDTRRDHPEANFDRVFRCTYDPYDQHGIGIA